MADRTFSVARAAATVAESEGPLTITPSRRNSGASASLSDLPLSTITEGRQQRLVAFGAGRDDGEAAVREHDVFMAPRPEPSGPRRTIVCRACARRRHRPRRGTFHEPRLCRGCRTQSDYRLAAHACLTRRARTQICTIVTVGSCAGPLPDARGDELHLVLRVGVEPLVDLLIEELEAFADQFAVKTPNSGWHRSR